MTSEQLNRRHLVALADSIENMKNERWAAQIKRNTNAWGKAFELNLFTQSGDIALRAQHDTVADCRSHLKRLQRQTGHKYQTEVQI